jgi:hypothetical protein
MTFLFVIAFTISHLEAAVRRELWLGDEFWLGTHTPLEGLIVIMAYFLVSRYIGEWYWLFIAYFLYKLLAVILNVQRRLWHNSHGQFLSICCHLLGYADTGVASRWIAWYFILVGIGSFFWSLPL